MDCPRCERKLGRRFKGGEPTGELICLGCSKVYPGGVTSEDILRMALGGIVR